MNLFVTLSSADSYFDIFEIDPCLWLATRRDNLKCLKFSECRTTFFNITPAALTSKYLGESAKLVKRLFDAVKIY